jgi:hypothetical protein
MANESRGEISIEIDGTKYLLALKMRDFVDLEDNFEWSLSAIENFVEDKKPGKFLKNSVLLLHVASGKKLSIDQLWDWADDVGLEGVAIIVAKVIETITSGTIKSSKNSKKK